MAKNLQGLLLAFTLLFAAASAAVQMRWCHLAEEKDKCEDLMKNLTTLAKNDLNMELNASCVVAKDALECMDKIQKKEADLVTLDGGHIIVAGKDHKMEVVVAEDYGKGLGTSYFAVAVVKRGSKFGIKDLKGKKSCHTGAGRTAGWTIPVGFLLSKDIMKRQGTSCNPYLDAGKFFSESCVPGALLEKFNPKKENPKNLCDACSGAGASKCSMSDQEPYYGYGGAFKCMYNGAGDVAFVKHTTTTEMTAKGNYGSDSSYEYLCPDGTRKAIGQHLDCNLGKSPSHAVMTWADNGNRKQYIKVLVKASAVNDSDIFNSAKYGGKDLLFKDSTVKLVDFGDRKSYKAFLDKTYVDDVEGINECITSTGRGLIPFGFSIVLTLFAIFIAV